MLWADQVRELYIYIMQKQLGDNDRLLYSTPNEGNSVVAEKFIETLKGKKHF